MPTGRGTLGSALLAALTGALALALALPGRAAEPAAAGYVGRGTIVVRATLPNTSTPIDVDGDLAFEQRGDLVRLDILALSLPGAGSVGSALALQLFPAGGVVAVFNRVTSSYTVWSTASRRYYSKDTTSASPAPNAVPTGRRPPVAANPFAFEQSLRTLAALNITIALSGHGTVNGHAATGVTYQFVRTTNAGDTTDAHGAVQFADDLDGVPIQFTASFKNKYVPQTSLRADLTQIVRQTPPDGDFRPPLAFVRASTLGDVLSTSPK